MLYFLCHFFPRGGKNEYSWEWLLWILSNAFFSLISDCFLASYCYELKIHRISTEESIVGRTEWCCWVNSMQLLPTISPPSCDSLFFSYFAYPTPLKLWFLVGASLVGFATEVIDFGHPWPMTLFCSLPSHQKLLLLRSKGSGNRIVGSVVFLTETRRGSELRKVNLHNTFPKVDKSPTRADKRKCSVKRNSDFS